MSNINKLYIVFPDSHELVCNLISEGLVEITGMCCKKMSYSLKNLTLESTYKISENLDHTTILILAYWGILPSESFYKLGIAFEKRSKIILINIQSDVQNIKEIPSYIKNDFLLTLLEMDSVDLTNNLKSLLLELRETIDIILAGDIKESLYHQSLIYCKRLEEITTHNIKKVDKDIFKQRIISYQESRNNHDLFELHRNQSDELYIILLSCIAEDKFQMYKVMTIARNSQRDKSERLDKSKNTVQNITYIQQGLGDNVAGDHIGGDKKG